MRQIELYVPTADNQGKPIRGILWGLLHADLRRTFQDFTTYQAEGQWQDGPTVYTDPIKVYRIVCKDDQVPAIKSIARWVKTFWHQESVLYTIQDVQATFV